MAESGVEVLGMGSEAKIHPVSVQIPSAICQNK